MITSLEYEKDPLFFLKEIRKLISQDGRLFIVKYNLWWILILKILGIFKLRLKRPYQNVISDNFLKNICEHSNFEPSFIVNIFNKLTTANAKKLFKHKNLNKFLTHYLCSFH